MKKLILLAVAASLIAASCNQNSVLKQDQVIQLKQFKLSVQLADTPEKRAAGLSGIPSIPDSQGMLFLFSEPQRPQFWMKGMNFPIDIIWIRGTKIVGISDNIKTEIGVPENNLLRYTPPEDIDKVLEVNAGWTFRHDINVGDSYTVVTP